MKRSGAVLCALGSVMVLGACTVNIGAPPNAPTTAKSTQPASAPTVPTASPAATSTPAAATPAPTRGESDPLSQVESQDWTAEVRTTEHFRLSVTRLKADQDTIGIKVKTCARSLPAGWEGSVRVSADPWRFLDENGYAVRAEHDDRFGDPLTEHYLRVGECVSGWITYDMKAGGDVPTGLRYENSLGETATF